MTSTLTLPDRQVVDVIIIGAGVAGLVCASVLISANPALRVQVLEAADRAGGQVTTTVTHGYTFEHGPTSMMWNPGVGELIDRLALTDRVVHADGVARGTHLWSEGSLHALPRRPLDAVRSGLLSWPAKARFLAEPLVGRRPGAAGETVASFAARRFGISAATVIAGAAVAGVTGGDAAALEFQSVFPRLWALDRAAGRRSLLIEVLRRRRSAPSGPAVRGPITLRDGGLSVLTESLAAAIGPSLRLNSTARAIETDGDGYRVTLTTGQQITSRQVVVAVPAQRAAGLLEPLSPSTASVLRSIRSCDMRVLGLGLSNDAVVGEWPGFGFLSAPGQGLNIIGATISSRAFPGQAPSGRVLLRAFAGGDFQPDANGTEHRRNNRPGHG